jgi:His-Xaa-Ser system protein HxsD
MTGGPVRWRSTVLVDLSLTCLPAIQRACYALSDRFDVFLDRKSGTIVELTALQQDAGPEPPSQDELNRLLLDFALRVDVEERTRDIRNAIVSAALRHAK